MNNDNNGSEKNEFPTIKPAEISLTRDADASGRGETAAAAPKPLNRRLATVLVILITAVILVVFILPRWVENPPLAPADNTTPSSAAGEPGSPGTGKTASQNEPAATPWSDAQLAKLRKQSQDLLEDMLEAEETLKEHQVQQWAGEAFNAALKTAEQGDTAYWERRFEEAVTLYRRALDQFTELVDSMDQVYEKSIQQGQQALADGDAEGAAEQFATALMVRPGDEAARRGQKRAGTLDEVNALIAEGDTALDEDRLADAKQKFSKVIEIDPYADRAKQKLAQTSNRIRDRDFREAMSRGYAALEQDRLEQAREYFVSARKLKPDSSEAADAISLAGERITTRRINGHLDAADQAAGSEEWQAAINHYQQALKLDNSLAGAQAGLQRARTRFNLDQRLEKAIANPERLWDQAVRQEARQLLQEASGTQPPGSKLSRQISDLKQLLEKATTPVTVQLRSDNQTSVTIYKVGDMGKFNVTSITLMPGRYVAVGTRPGYRDVRVEFTVRPDRQSDPVVVETRDKINFGSG